MRNQYLVLTGLGITHYLYTGFPTQYTWYIYLYILELNILWLSKYKLYSIVYFMAMLRPNIGNHLTVRYKISKLVLWIFRFKLNLKFRQIFCFLVSSVPVSFNQYVKLMCLRYIVYQCYCCPLLNNSMPMILYNFRGAKRLFFKSCIAI